MHDGRVTPLRGESVERPKPDCFRAATVLPTDLPWVVAP